MDTLRIRCLSVIFATSTLALLALNGTENELADDGFIAHGHHGGGHHGGHHGHHGHHGGHHGHHGHHGGHHGHHDALRGRDGNWGHGHYHGGHGWDHGNHWGNGYWGEGGANYYADPNYYFDTPSVVVPNAVVPNVIVPNGPAGAH